MCISSFPCSEKDREQAELDSEVSTANRNLQSAETMLSTLSSQLKQKRDDIRGEPLRPWNHQQDTHGCPSGMDRRLKIGFNDQPFEMSALQECRDEIAGLNRCARAFRFWSNTNVFR